MTKRDLFIVLLRILGLYGFTRTLFGGPPFLLSLFYISPNMGEIMHKPWMAIILVVLILALFVLLIVHADKLVERLKLADGYDDDRIDFGNLTAVSVVMIAIIIVGGLQIVTSIPELIEMMFIYFSDRVGRNQIGDYSINISGYDFIYPLLRLIIGVLLLTNYSALAKILTKKIPSQ